MTSVFKPLRSKVRLSRNAFDLSHRSVYSNRVGLLQPCLVMDCNPNEKFDIDVNNFVRTQPINTAAFVRVKQNIDFFFVPYRVLWHNFGNTYANTDFVSRTFTQYGKAQSSQAFPHFEEGWFSNILNSGKYDMFGYEVAAGAARLADMLGYGVVYQYSTGDSATPIGTVTSDGTSVNPFRFLAYQKIYQDFYRNPLYEPMDASTYNVDGLDTSIELSETLGYKYCQLRYAPWKRDYFTSIRPTFSGADFIADMGTTAPAFPYKNASSNVSTNVITSFNDGSLYANQSFINATTRFSINNLRSAFALDKLLKLTERSADGSYSEQIASRFGVRPRSDADQCIFLGSVDSPVQIGEVVSSADTSQSDGSGEVLGRIAGKGYSSSNGHISFETQEHGIIMAIQSFVPECDYASIMTERANTRLDRMDYFQPEFDELGYEPVYQYELSNFKIESNIPSQSSVNSVLGWNARYMDFKTCVDKVHGAFRPLCSLSSWVAPRSAIFGNLEYKNGITTQFTKINPLCLDSIFVYNGDGSSLDLLFDNDQFLCTTDFRITALRPMSVYGLPNV